MRQKLAVYFPIILLLFAVGLPTRIAPINLPYWYVTYAGDFIWAMMIYFLYRLFFRWELFSTFLITLTTTYLIEISQLFHPAWLDYLRSFKLVGLIIGYSFLWSDIVAYTAGIMLAATEDKIIVSYLNGKLESKLFASKNA